jgi:hypothetical protein
MCGMMTKTMFEGGDRERKLAKEYRQWSEALREYPRTSSLLARIAGEWDREASREDRQLLRS